MAEVTPTESETKGSTVQSKDRPVIIPREVKRGTTEMVWYQIKAELQQKDRRVEELEKKDNVPVERYADLGLFTLQREILDEVIDKKTDLLFAAQRGSLEDKYINAERGKALNPNYYNVRRDARKMDCNEAATFLAQIKEKYKGDLDKATDDDSKALLVLKLRAVESLDFKLADESQHAESPDVRKPVSENKSTSSVDQAEQKKEEETAVINEALSRGIFRTHFAGVFDGRYSGFNTWESKNKTDWKAAGRNAPNPVQLMIPAVYTTDYLDNEFKDFLKKENVKDAVYVTPAVNYDPNTKEVVFPGTSEHAVRVMYSTILRDSNMQESYTDENGRGGNLFFLDMFVPMSIAEKIVAEGSKDPGFYRKLAQSAVLDPEFGLEAANPGVKIKGKSEGVYAGSEMVRASKEWLPPYEDKDWKDSKMLVSVDLKVREEPRKIVDTRLWSREQKTKAGIGALTRYMKSP